MVLNEHSVIKTLGDHQNNFKLHIKRIFVFAELTANSVLTNLVLNEHSVMRTLGDHQKKFVITVKQKFNKIPNFEFSNN